MPNPRKVNTPPTQTQVKYVAVRHPTSTLVPVPVHTTIPQKLVAEVIEPPKETQMASTPPLPAPTQVPEQSPVPTSTSPPAPTPAPEPEVEVAPKEVELVEVKEETKDEAKENPRMEVTGDVSKAASIAAEAAASAVVSSIAASVGIKIEGEFASKDTERVSSVIAEGIAFLRENAERITQRILNGESPMIVSAIELAQWAERTMKGFSGLERKDVVMRLLNWLIDNQEDVLQNALGEDVEDLKHIVADVVPSVLDMVCAAAKGKLDLNTAKEVAKKCCVWWWSKQA